MSSNENKIDFKSSRAKRLYLTDIVKQKLIKRTDIRTIRKWCKDNNINVLKDISGEYVMEEDFNLAYNTPLITRLQSKHGKDWQSVYQYYINGELYKLVDVKQKAEAKPSRYISKGSIALEMQAKKMV